jgi:hypothetical protein
MVRGIICGVVAAVGLVALACSTDGVTGPGPGQGSIAVRLTDAPLPLDSVKEVNVFIVRVDARRARVDTSSHEDAAAALSEGLMALHRDGSGHDDDEDDDEREHGDSTAWVTIAEPSRAFNLLELRNGVTAFLGETPVDTGHFRAIRLVIDPTLSTIVLKDGTVLSPASNPPLEFESRGRHALFVEFEESVDVEEHQTTTVVLDIKLDASLSLRGRTVRDGFIFRPVVVGRCEQTHQ